MGWKNLPRMRSVLAFLSGAILTLLATLAFYPSTNQKPSAKTLQIPLTHWDNGTVTRIPCIINGDKQQIVDCRVGVSGDVLVPFSFLSKYFEVNGKIELDSRTRERVFNWQHANAKLVPPKLPYKTDGIFLSFDNYNVEVRDRVKCISAIEGVPVSSQWTSSVEGHIYPVQVAQFGLSHYSKNITDEPARYRVVADFENESVLDDLTVPDDCQVERELLEEAEAQSSWVLNFTAPMDLGKAGISIAFPDLGDPYVIFRLRLSTCGSVTLHLEAFMPQRTTYQLVYSCSSSTLIVDPHLRRIVYGVGTDLDSEWKTLVRDVYIDLVKGLNYGKVSRKEKVKPNIVRLRVMKMELHGKGQLDGVGMASSAHGELFEKAADWLVRRQDPSGGWPVQVKRKLGPATLAPGWLSAMAQGQAMSVLTRAYLATHNPRYLHAAVEALAPFALLSTQPGGVRALFLNQSHLPWFEEYPTTPPSFVLNGFIYALLGVYDVIKTVPLAEGGELAGKIFDEGLRSLKTLLPLFDTGVGSLYDLRHLTFKETPNVARWDYHATHITQLMVMNSIAPDPIFAETVQRWTGYMKGNRAPHN